MKTLLRLTFKQVNKDIALNKREWTNYSQLVYLKQAELRDMIHVVNPII